MRLRYSNATAALLFVATTSTTNGLSSSDASSAGRTGRELRGNPTPTGRLASTTTVPSDTNGKLNREESILLFRNCGLWAVYLPHVLPTSSLISLHYVLILKREQGGENEKSPRRPWWIPLFYALSLSRKNDRSHNWSDNPTCRLVGHV